MSIRSKLTRLLSERKLYELEPLLTRDETVRTMIVSAGIDGVVQPPFADTKEGERHAELRAWFDSFMEGGEITVAPDPDDKPRDAMLARVRPVKGEFWSIRVTAPEDTPGIRVLGAFADKDKFIALTWDYREDMSTFNDHVKSAMSAWKDLFGEETPFSGERLDDYLTNFIAV